MRSALLAISAFTVVLAAGCSDSLSDPSSDPLSVSQAGREGQSGVTVFWNQVARNLVIKTNSNPLAALRGYAVLSVAQYRGIAAAGGGNAPARLAVSGASAVALSYLYPTEAASIEALVDSIRSASGGGGDGTAEATGRAAAQVVVESAKTDNFFAPWSGTVPVGPGLWFSSSTPPAPPIGVLIGQARTFFLLTGNQFRPPPPPVFGSSDYLAALAEVRRISDTRTPQQDSIAKFWALEAGTYTPSGYWNEGASGLATRYHLKEQEAATVLALMNMVAYDAIVATHDAKYTYWFIRPSQADPGIKLAVLLPNHPSYSSNHAALSAGMARVLGAFFPRESARLDRLADQAAMSRLYAGIHYRFDNNTGLRLGRTIAAWALDHSGCSDGARPRNLVDGRGTSLLGEGETCL